MNRYDFGRLSLLPDERRVLVDGQPVNVGSRAFDVLLALAERRNRIVGKQELLQVAWPGLVVEDNNLTVQISSLRKLLGNDAIATIPGRGYRLNAEPHVATPEARSGGSRVGNLPHREQTLYGRDAETSTVADQCLAAPLLTLCGPGGIGKTSLAIVVANRVAAGFVHGAWLLELSAITEPGLLIPTVAHCLGVSLPGNLSPQDELVSALQPREALLVFDNCEHLMPTVAPLVHALVQFAVGVRVLATSQEPLRVPGEIVHQVVPLAVPPPGEFDEAESFGAVRLFVERVRARQADFQLATHEVANAVEICSQLDGIALAIELAAARVPLLGVAMVRSRLGERLRLLTTGARTAARRHQTLRATLEWSHQLLDEEGQIVLRRLAVFIGGFSLEAAQGLFRGPGTDHVDVCEHLAALVDKSLLVVEPGRRSRYRMLESMRAFALERLDAEGELETWTRRHAHVLADVCRRAVRSRDIVWMWAEMPNTRAALAWAVSTPGEGALAVALATFTAPVLTVAGLLPEAMTNLLGVEPLIDEQTPGEVVAAYWKWLGRFGMEGRLTISRCIEALKRATSLFEAQGNARHVHACLRMTAEACLRGGDVAAASAHLQAAASTETAETSPADRMRRLRVAALIADAGEAFPQALELTRQALEIAEIHRLEQYCQLLMAEMAWVQLHMGEPDAAVERMRKLLDRIQPGYRQGMIRAYALAGHVALLVAARRFPEARELAAQTVDALRASGLFMARSDTFAWLAAESGHPRAAAQLMAAADEYHVRTGSRRDRISQRGRDQTWRLVEGSLAPSDLEFCVQEGRRADDAVLAQLLEAALEANGRAELAHAD